MKRLAQEDPFHSAIAISPKGKHYFYLVSSPNIETNQADVDLYLASMPSNDLSRPKRILSVSGLSSVRWQPDGQHVTGLVVNGHDSRIEQIDAQTGDVDVLVRARDIAEYSVDAAGSTIVFATENQSVDTDAIHHSQEERDSGYRVVPDEGIQLAPQRTVWISRRVNGLWQKPGMLHFRPPLSGEVRTSFSYLLGLRLSESPDGQHVTLTYADVPPDWKHNPVIEARLKGFPYLLLTMVCDLRTTDCSMPLKSPWEDSEPLWSADSKSFMINAESPVDSDWMKQDVEKHQAFSQTTRLFQVNIVTGEIDQVSGQVPNLFEAPLAWLPDGTLLLHSAPEKLSKFARSGNRWSEITNYRIPLAGLFAAHSIASDGMTVLGGAETSTVPPYLFEYRIGDREVHEVQQLNPQFQQLQFAPVRHVQWETSTGLEIEGTLLVPPDYVEGKRYPLVIQTKVDWGQFACGAVDNDPSYAPQPLATSGIMYLMRDWPADRKTSDDRKAYPKGYPGQIGEAEFQKDIWENAVRTLVSDGLVDENRIGIVGFSRPGWYTEYMLTQSSIHFRAATIADNVDYSLASYSLYLNDQLRSAADAMYGGPPVGSTLQNWLKYSPTFNLAQIDTPILMEEMGYGQEYDNRREPPIDLARRFEFFNILKHMGKTVELYYYPQEGHQPSHPKARWASLQRNIAWFKRWLAD